MLKAFSLQIQALSSKRTGLVFLLWGKQAQDKTKKGTIQQAGKQHVLQSPHPSGLSAARVQHMMQCCWNPSWSGQDMSCAAGLLWLQALLAGECVVGNSMGCLL